MGLEVQTGHLQHGLLSLQHAVEQALRMDRYNRDSLEAEHAITEVEEDGDTDMSGVTTEEGALATDNDEEGRSVEEETSTNVETRGDPPPSRILVTDLIGPFSAGVIGVRRREVGTGMMCYSNWDWAHIPLPRDQLTAPRRIPQTIQDIEDRSRRSMPNPGTIRATTRSMLK